jgi:hypothetical protein
MVLKLEQKTSQKDIEILVTYPIKDKTVVCCEKENYQNKSRLYQLYEKLAKHGFVQAIIAQPAKIHAQNAIFHRQTALADRIYASIIIVNR